jgi:hypothetical protein
MSGAAWSAASLAPLNAMSERLPWPHSHGDFPSIATLT